MAGQPVAPLSDPPDPKGSTNERESIIGGGMRMKKIWKSISSFVKRIKLTVTIKTPIIDLSFALLIQPFRFWNGFFHNPNISFAIRLAPFTSPVRTSILKMSWPIYCHAMVTAGRDAFTAGELLDRNAE